MTEQPIKPIAILLCDICGKPVKEDYKDDIKTQWYKCENGHETSNPIRKDYTPNMYLHSSNYQDENEKFNQIKLAMDLVNNYFFRTDKQTGTIWVFQMTTGLWERYGEILIREIVADQLKQDYREHYLTDILSYIRAVTYMDLEETPNKLVVNNGVLNLDTRKLEQPNPGEFVITKLPVTHDKNAQCPKILKFLTEVFGENQLNVVQEFIGYCLYKAMPFHKAVMLLGEGANGKSTFLSLLKAFLGPENVAHETLQDLCWNRFKAAELYGKLANIRADLTKQNVGSIGRFKELTGGDTVSAEYKHKNPFSFPNYAKQIYSANEPPEIQEDTLAMFRRWIILSCNNVFLGEKCNPNIIEEITVEQELSGLLNYALDGLERLLKNKKFSVNETIEELRTTMIRKMNPAKAFIEEQLEYVNDPKAIIEEIELYRIASLWWKKECLPTTAKANFTKAMRQFFPEAKQTMTRIKGKPKHVWQFVKSVTGVTTPLFIYPRGKKNSKTNNKVVTVVTPVKNCGQCANFRMPSCESEGWETRNGNAVPLTNWCFKPRYEEAS